MNTVNNKKSVAIITNNLICEMNSKYYSTLEKYFVCNGWEIVTDYNADKIVISTCGYSDEMFKAIANILDELKSNSYSMDDVIILGCLTKTHEAELKTVFSGNIIDFHNEHLLDQIINANVAFKNVSPTNIIKSTESEYKSSKNELYCIQIANGCLKQCTFCVINKAHGDIHSYPIDDIIRQYKEAINNGYRNINLIGTDTFAYGYDSGTNIANLLNTLLEIDSDVNFYLGSMHARWLKAYWREILEICKKGKINSLHVVIQHVNDNILKRMGRPIQFKEIYDIVCTMKKECPNLFLSTDIIVGFPGESDEDFNELVSFVEKDKCFDMFNHFMYSDVKGAKAYNFTDKISRANKVLRWNILNQAIGDRVPVKVLNKRDDGQATRYKEVYKKQSENVCGYHFCKDTFSDQI